MAFQRTHDARREDFSRYLEKAGVLDTLTRCVVSLYEQPERAADPIAFIRESLGPSAEQKLEVSELEDQCTALHKQLTAAEQIHEQLQQLLEEHEQLQQLQQLEITAAAEEAAAAAAAAAETADTKNGKTTLAAKK